MAFIIKDRVKEGTVSTGTGAVTLGGASATFDPFNSYMVNGDTTYYAIVHTTSGVDEWEVGIGTWNTGNTLTRTTILSGSNGTSAVDFSAGTKDVFMTYPASKAAVAGEDVTFADITVTGTVDGRDVAADGTKLDTVEQNADVTDVVNVAAAGALMKSGGTMTGNLILNADPTAALGAATKEYVDTIASAGIHYHDPVRVETPSALTSTYNNGSSGVGATLTNNGTQAALVIDGVTMTLNDRVLVYNQTDETHNGIYTVTNVGSASTNWVMTRATDADSYGASDPDSFGKGDAFFVKEGNTGAGELYVMTTAGTITFGTTAIHFSQVAETAVYNAGTGLTLTGTTFSIGQDVGTTANVTFNQVTAAIIGNVTGNLTGDVTGNADTATALETARTIQLTGDVTGSATFDGSANAVITATVQDDSHSHVISNVDGLQTALDGKTATSRTITAGNGLTGGGDLTANRTLNVGAGSGITVTADAVSHADTSTQASVNNSGRTYIQDITLDGFGHITGLTSATETVTDTTYSAGSGLDLSGTTFSHTDTSSQASVNNSSGTVIQDITLDTYGHITGINSINLDGRYYTESEADSRFVNASGDTMSGSLTIPGALKITETGTAQHLLIGNQDSGGANKPAMLMGVNGQLRLGYGNSWSGEGGTFTSKLTVGSDGVKHNGTDLIFHDGYHPNADKWTTARTLSLSGDASGSVSWDGSANATLSVAVADDSHSHTHLLSDGTTETPDSALQYFQTSSNTNINPTSDWYNTIRMGHGDPVSYYSNTIAVNMTGSNPGDLYTRTIQNGAALGWNRFWHNNNDGSGSGLDADLLDGVQGSSFLRSDATDYINGKLILRADIEGGDDGYRDHGVYGSYDSYRIDHIWSMGTAYRVNSGGSSFGNLYGLAYTYSNRVYTSNAMAGGHQMVWCQNGTPYAAMGSNIWTSGNVTAYSDRRVKTNLEVIPDAIDKVKKLNGYTFDRTDVTHDEETGEPTVPIRQTGVVAQEVLEVLPEAVTGSEESHYNVAYGNMVGLLIEAIKEQQRQIDELKARLEA